MVQIELWQLLGGIASVIVAFAAMMWAFGKVLANQFKAGLDERFNLQDEMRRQREKALDERFKRMEADIDERHPGYPMCDGRMNKIEAELGAAPTHDNLSEIHDKINSVADDVAHMKGELHGISDNVRAIMNRFIQKGIP